MVNAWDCDENGIALACRPRPTQIAPQLPRPTFPREVARTAAERYQIDHEAVAGQADPMGILEDLVAAISTPGWTRETECNRCYDWDSHRSRLRPSPPRAQDPCRSCAGCTWSYLDGADAQLLRDEERLDRLKKLESSWSVQMGAWRVQALAKRWSEEQGRFIEAPQGSSHRRWQAKMSELQACRKLIAALEDAVGQARRRPGPLTSRFIANRPADTPPWPGCLSSKGLRQFRGN